MLVLQKHNTEMTVAAGEALYTLVCLHQVSMLLSGVQIPWTELVFHLIVERIFFKILADCFKKRPVCIIVCLTNLLTVY